MDFLSGLLVLFVLLCGVVKIWELIKRGAARLGIRIERTPSRMQKNKKYEE